MIPAPSPCRGRPRCASGRSDRASTSRCARRTTASSGLSSTAARRRPRSPRRPPASPISDVAGDPMTRRRFVCSTWMVGVAMVALLMAASADAQRRDRAKEEVPPPLPGGPIYQPPTPAMNISGVWWTQSYSPKLQLTGGGALPLNDKGKEQYAKNIAGLKDGTIVDEARHVCVPDGLPRILGNPYPFQLIQTPGQVTFVYELNHVIRPVVMDKPQLSAKALEVAPYYSGHSVGHWDGE